MAAVKLSAVVFLVSSADVSASLSCCSCTLRNCFCRLTLASSRSFFASLAARYFRIATLKEITATVSAMAAVMILPWPPRKASRNVQSIELMALISSPTLLSDPRRYVLRFLFFDAFCSFDASILYSWAFVPKALPRLRPAARGRFPNGACSGKVLLAVRLRHFVPAGNQKSRPPREWPSARTSRPKISHHAVTELSRHLMSSRADVVAC